MEVLDSLNLGDYKILQDTELYRFTSDSVLLGKFVSAKRGERVADFCAGSGIVGLHFYALNRGVERVVFFEIQKNLFELSKKTIALNKLEGVFFAENTDIREIPSAYTEYFSLVLCNPPYEKDGFQSPLASKAIAKKELTLGLEELVAAAKRCLKFGGRFALVHRADRLSEVLCALSAQGLEPKRLQLVAGKEGAKPYAALILAVKGGKRGLDVLPVLVNRREQA